MKTIILAVLGLLIISSCTAAKDITFVGMVTQVYKADTASETIPCASNTSELQTRADLKTVQDEVAKYLYYKKGKAEADPVELGETFKKFGWNNSICYPRYPAESYKVKKLGEPEKILSTKAGTSLTTWFNDTNNETYVLGNLVYKNGVVNQYYSYYHYYNDTERQVVEMNVTEIDWDCQATA